MHQPILIIFVDSIIKYSVQILFLAWPFSFRDTVCSMTEKDTISGVHVSPDSAETLAIGEVG